MKRFSLTALFLALAFIASSTTSALAVGNGTIPALPNPRQLALAAVAVALVLVSKFRHGGSF